MTTTTFDGDRCQRLRADACLSRAALAKIIGRHENTIYKWETGKSEPSASELHALAMALSATVDDFYSTRRAS